MDNKEIEIIELNNESIEKMIYVIRDKKVMLDFDLARIYGYETRRFNEQVKRNIDKFPERYRFKLNQFEIDSILKSHFATSSWGGTRKLPYAFTEQGIYMLMTVLKGDLATKQSIALIDAFKNMKDYIIENNGLLLNTNTYIESKFASYDKRFEVIENKIDIVMDNFIDPSSYKHYLILNGQRIESDIACQSIYKLAKYSLIIIDNYIDIKTLQLLKVCNKDINIIIISDNVLRLGNSFINDFKKDTNINIIIKPNNNLFHDRYIIIDYDNNDNYQIYHCGSSSKDGGNKISTIMKIEDKMMYKKIIDKMIII
ncbi:MAG: ORF6N domain-containing protein [Bacilli bacterium]|nr:ORF6N domain-containing protein [Bacilli bacterium]